MENTNMGTTSMENRTTIESNVEQAMEYVRQHYRTAKVETLIIKCIEALIRNRYEQPDNRQDEEFFKGFLSALGFDSEEIRRIFECDFPDNILVPVDVGIVRYYRTYVICYEGADEVAIRQKAIQQIVETQEELLTPDPDLDIEEDDVIRLRVDFDGIQED